MRRTVMFAAIAGALIISGCSARPHTVATDVKVIEKPVPVPCRFTMPARPQPHVALVQLSGDPLGDLVRIWRAAEAELEERRAYEIKLEAAAQACAEGKPP